MNKIEKQISCIRLYYKITLNSTYGTNYGQLKELYTDISNLEEMNKIIQKRKQKINKIYERY